MSFDIRGGLFRNSSGMCHCHSDCCLFLSTKALRSSDKPFTIDKRFLYRALVVSEVTFSGEISRKRTIQSKLLNHESLPKKCHRVHRYFLLFYIADLSGCHMNIFSFLKQPSLFYRSVGIFPLKCLFI